MYSKLVFLLFAVLLNSISDAYKILVLFPYPGKSHGILGEGYVRHLTKAGHEVTYIASVPLMTAYPGLRQIDVSKNFDIYPAESYLNISMILNNEISLNEGLKHFTLIVKMMNSTIHNDEVQKIMMDPNEQFDAVIAEWMYSELYAGFSAVFGCPLIWSSSMDPHALVMSLIDEIPNPAYIPDHISSAKPPLSLLERFGQLLLIAFLKYLRWTLHDTELVVYAQGFGPAFAKRGRDMPSLDVIKYNASLMLGNSHVSSGNPVSLPQNYKAIGGYHIEENTKPLPKEWQKLMEEAPHGVVYFSMGTMLKSNQLPEELKKGLLDVFRGLKQTVIWKFQETLSDMPNNVHIVNWAPQQSILAHPNCVMFITHAGLLSTSEALHFGVPIIGIPIFADQFNNINRAVSKGFGKQVSLNYDLPANLKIAIEDILGNSKYRDAVKEMSFVYHHRPVPPGAELVHWVEHVIKTRGAPHLRSPALHVPWYQKIFLDLAALIIIQVIFITYIIKLIFAPRKKVDLNKKYK